MSAALGKAGGAALSLRTKLTLAAGAASAWALKAGKAADDARKTIVEGTGATGAALDSLVSSYENLGGAIAGVSLDETSTAIADLNTHLGLAGPELEQVATQALKAGVNTNQFGAIAAKMGLDVQGSTQLLDQLVAVSQNTGVGVNEMLRSVQRMGPRFQAAGVPTADMVAIVAQLAEEAGPGGARSALSELAEEVDKGNIPAFKALSEQVGDVTGKVNETHAAGVGFLEQLGALKDRTMVLVGENGNLIGSLGSIGTAMIGIGPLLPALATGFRAVWAAITGPVGLAVTAVVGLGAAFYTFRDTIGDVLAGVIRFVGNWVTSFIDTLTRPLARLPGALGRKFADVSAGVRGMVDDATGAVADWVDAWGEAPPPIDHTAASAKALTEETHELIPAIAGVTEEVNELSVAFINASEFTRTKGQRLLGVREALRGVDNNLQHVSTATINLSDHQRTAAQRLMGVRTLLRENATEARTLGDVFRSLGGIVKQSFTGIMSAVHGFADGGWKGGLSQLTNVALSFLPPGMAQAAQAALGAFKGIWNKFFRKPGEAELAARASFDSIQQSFRTNLGDMAEYQEYFNSLVAQGWDENQAEVKAGFDYWGRQAGVSWAEIGALHTRYLEAVKAGNAEEIAAVEAVIQAWRDQSDAVADNTAAVDANAAAAEHSAEEVARQFRGLTDDEAAALSQALLDLGSNANRAFTDMHDSALAAGNAVALLLNRLQEAVSQRWQASIGLAADAPEPRAAGGPVSAGSPYLVGERGPELFVPNRSGSVVPNAAAVQVNVEVKQDRSGRWTARQVAHALGEAQVIA